MHDSEFMGIAQAAYGPLVLFARQWDDDLAEDVVQTAMMKFWQCFKNSEKPENAASWLFKTVRNELKYRIRQKKSDKKHIELHAKTQPPWFLSSPETRLDAKTVANELAKLSIEFREVIVAKIWGDLTFAEVAELLGLPRSTAHRRYLDGLKQLREKVKR